MGNDRMSSRSRWKTFALLAAVLVVGMVTTCLLVGKAQERTTVFGEIDREAGLRCRVTLSTGWKQQAREIGSPSFVASPLSPVQQWIDRHLLHRPTSQLPTISLGRFPIGGFRGFCLREGYPELVQSRRLRMLSHRRLHVDGYPATLIEHDYRGTPSLNVTALFVYVPNHATVYAVYGLSEASNADRFDREMQAVIASFHIEKVVPTGGKQ
ncbi:MAG: hypothetical protein JWL77_1413 [Chthonomonadaceae bacterium]|nr:hypothetical protein [Chthonomonadaceae bacterium]